MTADDGPEDRILAAVASVRTYDVSPRHTRALRRRCHALLQMQALPSRSIGSAVDTAFHRVLAPALGVAWCVAYLVEITRRAAAAYGLLP